jgi:hypothetical protein
VDSTQSLVPGLYGSRAWFVPSIEKVSLANFFPEREGDNPSGIDNKRKGSLAKSKRVFPAPFSFSFSFQLPLLSTSNIDVLIKKSKQHRSAEGPTGILVLLVANFGP